MPESVREQLERLPVPPERPAFFEELWEQAEVQKRAAALRWRRTSAALAVVAIAAATAAGVFAFGDASARTIDETYVCTGAEQGGVSQVVLNPLSSTRIGVLTVWANHIPVLRTSFPKKNQINVDPAACRQTSRSIPLRRSALPAVAHSKAGPNRNAEASFNCWAANVLVRLRVTFDARGDPATTIAAVGNARTGKVIAFIGVIPPHLDAFAAPACRHY